MAALEYHTGPRGAAGFTATVTQTDGTNTSTKRPLIPAVALVDSTGADLSASGSGLPTTTAALPGGTDRSGTATTSSAQIVAANTARNGLYIQNIGANNIGVNEFGGTAAIGTAGTYTLAPRASMSVRTNRAITAIAATESTAFTATEF